MAKIGMAYVGMAPSVLSRRKGHNYIGHNYIGHNYVGLDCAAGKGTRGLVLLRISRCHSMSTDPSLHKCVYTFLFGCLYTCICTCQHRVLCTRPYTCIPTCINTCLYTCLYTCPNTCRYACRYTCPLDGPLGLVRLRRHQDPGATDRLGRGRHVVIVARSANPPLWCACLDGHNYRGHNCTVHTCRGHNYIVRPIRHSSSPIVTCWHVGHQLTIHNGHNKQTRPQR